MRNISAAALTELQTKLGTEPQNIIEISWTAGGQPIAYGDKDIPAGNIKGRILDVSGLDNVISVSGGGQSQQISVTLDDTDGSIKAILDTADIHKRPAWVYQHFDGLALSDKFLIFAGQINSPIEWNEGTRTVRFDIVSRIEDAEVGIDASEMNLPGVPEELTGRAFPLCFGTVVNVPALRIKSARKGILKTGFGIVDPTLEPRLEQLKRTCVPLVFQSWRMEIEPGSSAGWGGGSLVFRPVFVPDPQLDCQKRAEILALEQQIAAQRPFEYPTIEVIDGDKFPQNKLITLRINDAELTGRFTGNIFHVTSRRHPELDVLTIPPPKLLACPSPGAVDPFTGQPANNNVPPGSEPVCIIETGELDVTSGTAAVSAWDYLSRFPSSTFAWQEAGSEVFLATDDSLVFVANILPSDIIRVAAWRTFPSGVRQLTTVPSNRYSVRISDFNSYSIAEIVVPRALSRLNQGWEDDLFVTLTSDIGNNVVDEVEWLIQKYTTYGIDATSFNASRTKLEPYPNDFALLDRRNLIELLEDIGFQNRSAIFLKDGIFHWKYLSEEPTPSVSITASDVIANSLFLTHSPTEDLCTKFVAEWKRDYALDSPNKVILRHNVGRYGVRERNFDFFCFAHQELVIKSATFWLVRFSNVWRRARFQTPLHKLQVEVFDPVSVDLSHLSDAPVKCIVEAANYDSANHTINFEVWTPVRSGERTPYDFAFPAQIQQQLVYPDASAIQFSGGSAPNVAATPPAGHVLGELGGLQGVSLGKSNPCLSFNNQNLGCFADRGDPRPSDIGDVKPQPKTAGSDAAIPPSKNPVAGLTPEAQRFEQLKWNQFVNNVANRQAAETAKNGASGGTAGGANPSPLEKGAGAGQQSSADSKTKQDWLESLPSTANAGHCAAIVNISWCPNVTSVLKPDGSPGLQPGDTGSLATCSTSQGGTERIATNSQAAAEAIAESIRQIVLGPATVGTAHPTSVSVNPVLPPDCPEGNPQATIGYDRPTVPLTGGRGIAEFGGM